MGHGVRLSREEPERQENELAPSWRLVITASNGCDMPEEIFLFQRVYADDNHTTTVDQLITVCTPFDLTTYPIGSPAVGQDPPFFRAASIDMLVPSLDAADYAWEQIRSAVTSLVSQLDRLSTLTAIETVDIGDTCDSTSVSESL